MKPHGTEAVDYGNLGGETWTFPARPVYAEGTVQVVDGDTMDCVTDLGFHVTREVRLRLYGVDTGEIYGPGSGKDTEEYQLGQTHKGFVEDWLLETHAMDGSTYPLQIYTLKEKGKFGRYVADVRRHVDDESLVNALIDEFPDVVDE